MSCIYPLQIRAVAKSVLGVVLFVCFSIVFVSQDGFVVSVLRLVILLGDANLAV